MTSSIVLVHGAWFSAHYWEGLVAELDHLGAPVVAVELPFTGFHADVAAARQAIEAAGPGVVVVGHSYGGCVISAAAAGMTAVARLVYVAAFLTDSDESPSAILSEHHSELRDAYVRNQDGLGVDLEKARHIFFGDADDAIGFDLASQLRPMPGNAAGISYPTDPAWKTLPSTYLLCSRDRALPPEAQRWMASRADTVIEWPTDHTPFISRPKELARLLSSYLP